MTSRRIDAVYFGLILLAALIAYLGSEFGSGFGTDELSSDEIADFDFPELQREFEFPPIELPELAFAFSRATAYHSLDAQDRPVRQHHDAIESELIKVRSVLLATSKPTELAQTD